MGSVRAVVEVVGIEEVSFNGKRYKTCKERTPMTIDQMVDPDFAQHVINRLKTNDSLHDEDSLHLINCLIIMINSYAEMVGTIIPSPLLENVNKAYKELVDLVAQSVDKIHEAMLEDYEDGIMRL